VKLNPAVARDRELGKQHEKDARELEKYVADHPGESLYQASMALLRKRRLASKAEQDKRERKDDAAARREAIAKAPKTRVNQEIETALDEAADERKAIQAESQP
jgi:hypothetical protein